MNVFLDLVPQENLRSWLIYLRKEYPTVAFQSMQIIYEQPKSRALKMRYRSLNQKPKIKEKTECLGGKRLMDVIKSYRKEKGNANLTVGVVGKSKHQHSLFVIKNLLKI